MGKISIFLIQIGNRDVIFQEISWFADSALHKE